MENASKALIISGGVLIGIIILSLGSYLFFTMGSYMSNTQDDISKNTIIQFNNEFLKYNGQENLTIQDVITVKNYALENNIKHIGYDVNNDRAEDYNEYIDVYICIYYTRNNIRKELILTKTDEELLKTKIDKKYTCTVLVNNETGRVSKVNFYES